jgi:transcriptional regulator with GAF, ATPase, and Fis domain
MKSLVELIDRVAPSTAAVAVFGESGTGKELVARAIHSQSNRAAAPFIPVNCAAISRELIESELFGHEKGAFTGALNARKGAFEEADGGTIFLDEIGELPLELQAKLLRALESGEIKRVGAPRPINVDVRVVAATNRDLLAMSREGKFREDLYYRLCVIPLNLPPPRALGRSEAARRALPEDARTPGPAGAAHARGDEGHRRSLVARQRARAAQRDLPLAAAAQRPQHRRERSHLRSAT